MLLELPFQKLELSLEVEGHRHRLLHQVDFETTLVDFDMMLTDFEMGLIDFEMLIDEVC
jgi:hypothetical protein